MQAIHRRINRADVTKDAKQAKPVIINNEFFNKCANTLFGEISKMYTTELQELNNTINTLRKISYDKIYPKIKLPYLRHPFDPYVSYLPEHVTHAIQDNGILPSEFKESLVNVITPATYIDSAGKSDSDSINYGFNNILTKTILEELGIYHIDIIKTKLKVDNECIISIKFTFGITINILFDRAFKPYGENSILFLGNKTKNEWFNTHNYTPNNYAVGCIFILCKELGDLLQAYYGKQYEKTLSNGVNRVCLFTTDQVLAMRCKLLDLPVVALDHAKRNNGLYECFYYPQPGIVDADIKRVFQNIVRVHNESIINTIDNVLKHQIIILHDTQIKINDIILDFITTIKNTILVYNSKLSFIFSHFLTIQQYSEELKKYLANYMFVKDTGSTYYKANSSIKSISNGGDAFPRKLYFDDYLQSLYSMSGGGNDTEDEIDKAKILAEWETHFNHAGDDLMEDASLDTQLRRRLYVITRNKHPEKTKIHHTEVVYALFEYLFGNFFGLQETVIDMNFLSKIVDGFYDGTIPTIDSSVFYKIYYSWRKEKFGIDESDDEENEEPEKDLSPEEIALRSTILEYWRSQRNNPNSNSTHERLMHLVPEQESTFTFKRSRTYNKKLKTKYVNGIKARKTTRKSRTIDLNLYITL